MSVPAPTRFYGRKQLDPVRAIRDFGDLGNADDGSVAITVEINAESAGFDARTRRTVSENAAQLTPGSSVKHLTGVGPARLKLLQRLEIRTLADLIRHLPHSACFRDTLAPTGYLYSRLYLAVLILAAKLLLF